MRLLERRRLAPAEHDVEAEAERPVRLRSGRSRTGDRAVRAPLGSRIELKIGSNGKSGSPGKYICVTSRSVTARPNSEKWMCAGRHAFGWFAPRVGAGLDGHEAVGAVIVGQAAAPPGEVRIERRVVRVDAWR